MKDFKLGQRVLVEGYVDHPPVSQDLVSVSVYNKKDIGAHASHCFKVSYVHQMPEFKHGQEIECCFDDKWDKCIYACPHPKREFAHIITTLDDVLVLHRAEIRVLPVMESVDLPASSCRYS